MPPESRQPRLGVERRPPHFNRRLPMSPLSKHDSAPHRPTTIGEETLPVAQRPIKGQFAASLVGLNWPGAFNNARRRMQRAIMVKGTNMVIWVVDIWGGVKYPGAEWSYDEEKCRRAARGDVG